MIYLRRLTELDKSYMVVALANVGVKARIRKGRYAFRICFKGEQTVVLAVLNGEGYRSATGGLLSRHSCDSPNEIIVHGTIQ